MISPALLKKAMDKRQERKADGFNAPAFFGSSFISENYVERYFLNDPVALIDSSNQMFEESNLNHMTLPLSVWEMLKEEKE